jgi:peptidyl-prolyl cis-trans isomerase D
MIKLIHRYNKIITYVFLFVAICFMFSGVGLDILQSAGVGNRNYAIKVNDREISPIELERAKQNLTARYQSMFGDKYESFAKQLNLNITQQSIDSLIDSNLLIQEADRWGFAGSDDGVNKYLLLRVFKDREVSKEAITNILQNLGMNYRQFSSEIKEELSREAFTNLVRDAAYVTDRDVQERFITQETKLSLLVASLDPTTLKGDVADPSEELITKSYNQNAARYEIPARISYEYIVFSPPDFAKDVPITAQDLELYYTENLARFKTPEQARIKAITKLYPKDADPKVMADLKATAKSIHEEALTGKPFASLVSQYSDDMPTKLAGGDRGWVERGKGSKAFDKAVFSTQAGGVAELIESSTGFEIVLVEERRPAGQKEFSTVKSEIENTLRQREAPAYASAKALELVNEVKRNKGTLRAIALNRPGIPAPKVVTLG